MSRSHRKSLSLALLVVLTLGAVALARAATAHHGRGAAPGPHGGLRVALGRALYGVSGALRVKIVMPGETFELPLTWRGTPPADTWYRWLPALGTSGDATPRRKLAGDVASAPLRPGIYSLEVAILGDAVALPDVHLVVKVPADRAEGGYLNSYYIGRYPARALRGRGRYAPPAGFIEVTRANEALPLSEHLTLRQFLTHDQGDVWPKYAIVDPRLVEKLELVLAELGRMGVSASQLHVMSGFRTPQYNRRGLGSGRAVLSRHQYGDAADVWVGGDWVDDLNGDGRRDMRDVAVMLRAVDRVERAHPELVGGAGTYFPTRSHGPFIHIDARGRRARWGGARGD